MKISRRSRGECKSWSISSASSRRAAAAGPSPAQLSVDDLAEALEDGEAFDGFAATQAEEAANLLGSQNSADQDPSLTDGHDDDARDRCRGPTRIREIARRLTTSVSEATNHTLGTQ